MKKQLRRKQGLLCITCPPWPATFLILNFNGLINGLQKCVSELKNASRGEQSQSGDVCNLPILMFFGEMRRIYREKMGLKEFCRTRSICDRFKFIPSLHPRWADFDQYGSLFVQLFLLLTADSNIYVGNWNKQSGWKWWLSFSL